MNQAVARVQGYLAWQWLNYMTPRRPLRKAWPRGFCGISRIWSIRECRVKCRYALGEVLLLAVAAVTSDCDGLVDMEDYGRQKIDVLREFLPYRNGIPTHGQIGNIMGRLNPEQFRLCFAAWQKADGIASDIVEEGEEYAAAVSYGCQMSAWCPPIRR